MQAAAHAEFKVQELSGSAATYIGFGMPAFIFTVLLSVICFRTHNIPAILSAFAVLQAILISIMEDATFSIGQLTARDWKGIPHGR